MKLIALNINNLTDARYFAARGVEYLAFQFPNNLEEAPAVFKKIETILEWVEGVQILLHCNENNMRLITSENIPFNFDGFIVPLASHWHKNLLDTEKKVFIEISFNRCRTIETFNKTLAATIHNFPILLLWKDSQIAFNTICAEILSNNQWHQAFENTNREVYIQIPALSENTPALLKYFNFKGIVISAGEETIIGEKNYDTEDALLDALENM